MTCQPSTQLHQQPYKHADKRQARWGTQAAPQDWLTGRRADEAMINERATLWQMESQQNPMNLSATTKRKPVTLGDYVRDIRRAGERSWLNRVDFHMQSNVPWSLLKENCRISGISCSRGTLWVHGFRMVERLECTPFDAFEVLSSKEKVQSTQRVVEYTALYLLLLGLD